MRENDYHEKKVMSVMRSSELCLLLFFFFSPFFVILFFLLFLSELWKVVICNERR